jgi:membrane protein
MFSLGGRESEIVRQECGRVPHGCAMYNQRMNFDPLQLIDDFIWGDVLEKRGWFGRLGASVLRYLYAIARDFFSGQLTLRAMSLVYTTLLSIVPLLAFSFSILKGLGVHKQLESQLYRFLEPFGERGVEITDQIIALVNNVNGRALGAASLAFFLYTAISMVQKIEESFNYVWYVSETRSFARRFTEYVFVMLIGPVIIVIALGLLGSLQNESAVQWLLENQLLGPLFVEIGNLMPYAMISGVFTFLYMFMPNTKVRLSAGLVGGIAGGCMWATLSAVFTSFIVTSGGREAVYAGFAIPIATLIWLYLNWLVLLVGAQVAFYFQNPAYLRIGRRDPRLSNAMRERLSLNIMFIVGQAFRDPSRAVKFNELSEQLRIPSVTVAPIAEKLEAAGFLKVTEKEELQPGRDLAGIRLRDVLTVVRDRGETGSHHSPLWDESIDALGKELDSAFTRTLGDKTLAELLDSAEVTT